MGLEFTNLIELEEMARAKISRSAFDYIAGGSDDEVSLRRNREAYSHWALRPRVLVDVSRRDTSTTVLGERVSMPVLVAPTAFHGLVHPEGELATARGTAEAGTIMVASTLATRSLEEIAAVGSALRWFQLYLVKDRAFTETLVRRAEKAGYRALCVTVDAALVGRRERDVRNAFSIPVDLAVRNLEEAGAGKLPPAQRGRSALADYWEKVLDASNTWKTIEWLRSISSLPVVLKGIMTAEDAEIAVEHGAEGIVVSNHGGRQLDGTLGTLDALPDVVAGVKGRAELYIDGGVRRGTDVLKALALGAKAVLVGRPVLYGLALGGADGVRAVLERLRTEFDLALGLVGKPTVSSVDRSIIHRISETC